MRIYLVRHGDSNPLGSDNGRLLSDAGRADIERLAKFLAPQNLQISRIFHSEKARARETAQLLSTALATPYEFEILTELDPTAPIEPVARIIHALESDTMFVGHMPFMGRLISKLIAGTENLDTVLFKTGTIACLEQLEQTHWIVRWVLNPELL